MQLEDMDNSNEVEIIIAGDTVKVKSTDSVKDTIKKTAERKAMQEDMTLQEIFNRALEEYLEKDAKKQAKKIVFKTHDLGEPLDNLTRDDFYPNP